MRVENSMIQFDFLSMAGPIVGDDEPVAAKEPSSSFHSSNAPGEPEDICDLAQIEQMGKNAVLSFNRLFA